MLATAVGFELQLHPIAADGILPGVTVIWPLPLAVDAFQWYNDWQEGAPAELTSGMAFATTPMGKVATVSVTNWDPDNNTEVTEALQVMPSRNQEKCNLVRVLYKSYISAAFSSEMTSWACYLCVCMCNNTYT